MNKALIEKAFKKYCITCCSYRQTNGSDECENTNICKHAWGKGATWQREQIIKELREFAEKNSHQSYAGQPQFKTVDLTQFLAKLDLLEGEK